MDVISPMPGTVVALACGPGDEVAAGTPVVVVESMKVEHEVVAPVDGVITALAVAVGDTVTAGRAVATLRPGAVMARAVHHDDHGDAADRVDLAEVLDRHDRLGDHRRPAAVARRHQRGRRTARANLDDLVDPGSFVEYGALAVAAQSRRRDHDDLVERTSTDGVITGVATINADLVGPRAATCAVVVYDDTVLAGTQGFRGHRKQDRLLTLATRRRLPTVVFAEGGGGRPGDVDVPTVAGLDVPTFRLMARLSGRVPTVAVAAGYCFAGNAVLAACADVVVATEDVNLGAGGPAMIEGGGLGRVAAGDIGPIDDVEAAGVVDVRVADEAEATAVARRYLSYFQGPLHDWSCGDQARLRRLVPEDRVKGYDVRAVIDTVADTGSVLELRPAWGRGVVSALARVEGRAVGVVANDVTHLGGALDRDGATKAARFLHLCDAFDLPVVVLCDTPGIMVGPDAERAGTLRHAARLMVAGANLDVPVGTVVLRKGYGLGAQAMAAGAFTAGDFTVAWPTGEFGGMNLEGAVALGYAKELAAIADPDERETTRAALVAAAHAAGRALRMAEVLEIDAVIDPADTRRWIASLPDRPPRWRSGDHRAYVDPV